MFGAAAQGFHRIQVGHIGRRQCHFEPRRSSFLQLPNGRAMDVEPFEHDDQRSAGASVQVTDEGDDAASLNVIVVELPANADRPSSRRQTDRTDRREPVVPGRDVLNRRLSAGGPGAAGYRLEQKARFIEKHDGCAAAPGLFLIRGQSSVRHRAIAVSFRSAPRRRGFYCVKPKASSKRPTWSGWYVTPNSRRITSATRLQVHQSVVKPAESGPARTISANRCRSATVSSEGPGIGLDFKA